MDNNDDTTNIKMPYSEENYAATVFDITGRRIKGVTIPGIYIINGQKRVVQ